MYIHINQYKKNQPKQPSLAPKNLATHININQRHPLDIRLLCLNSCFFGTTSVSRLSSGLSPGMPSSIFLKKASRTLKTQRLWGFPLQNLIVMTMIYRAYIYIQIYATLAPQPSVGSMWRPAKVSFKSCAICF